MKIVYRIYIKCFPTVETKCCTGNSIFSAFNMYAFLSFRNRSLQSSIIFRKTFCAQNSWSGYEIQYIRVRGVRVVRVTLTAFQYSVITKICHKVIGNFWIHIAYVYRPFGAYGASNPIKKKIFYRTRLTRFLYKKVWFYYYHWFYILKSYSKIDAISLSRYNVFYFFFLIIYIILGKRP